MRFLAALALLVVAVTAHHSPEHQLGYPKFVVGKTHVYDVSINMTSGIPGLHSQVAKSVLQTELKVYAKTSKELYISMHKVMVSESLPGVNSKDEQVVLKPNRKLEDHLKVPIKAVLEQGMITSYTLDENESLESQKIKRSVLRHLELYLDEKLVRAGHQTWWPLTYNVTRSTPVGNYSSHYIVTSSPYAEFPQDSFVFNISRTDNYEVIPYLAYETHHNFEQQGCSDVCKKDQVENRLNAGCPPNYEPYQAPMKRSFVQHHNIRRIKDGNYIIDSVQTKETHVADVYDQNMEVTIKTVLKFKKTLGEPIPEPTGQKKYFELDDYIKEVNEREITAKCRYPDPREAIEAARNMMKQVAEIVLSGDIEGEKPKMVGEKLILLQKALTVLKQGDLRTIQESIVSYDDLHHASPENKVIRQIWLDNLPVVGTSESIAYIVQLIQENMNRPNKAVSLLEAKSILEALPENILRPSEKTITQLSSLLEIMNNEQTPGYSMYYSAAHLTVARVIRNMCAVDNGIPHEEQYEPQMRHEEAPAERLLKRQDYSSRRCPKSVVKKFLLDVAEKLKRTENKSKRIIYIETLARTGLQHVLPYLAPYVNGHVDNVTPSYIDFLRTVAINALHNIVNKHPRDVQSLVLPIFYNRTESPKVRISAFSVYVKSQPTIGGLQHVAEESWKETSIEVGSFVTSTLETFGNSSTPCYQLTALRIKKVLPQLKRFDHGYQHSKNILWDMFDDVRGFGFHKRFEYVPSNESFIPSILYGSLGYNADALRDVFFQYALNIQGLTSRNVWDSLLSTFGIEIPADIPKEKESEIFPEMNIAERMPEFWRFTMYEKMFYYSSYYYMDGEESNKNDIVALLKDQFTHYFKMDAQGNVEGHLVKVYLPSSYRTKSISKSLTYPIEFEIKNPLLISLKLNLKPTSMRSSSSVGYELHVKPSVYYSTLYTNQILNLGDCKDIGVYHEKRVAATYPVVVKVEIGKQGKFIFSYKFPELPKKIFTYHSEAGTYAGQKKLVALPPMEDRRTIKTIPSQFKKQNTWGLVGLPPFESEVYTEDIQFGTEEIPRTLEEAVSQFVQHFLNAGWRRKTVNIKRVPQNSFWSPSTEVKVNIEYLRQYVSPAQPSSEDWTRELKFDDTLSNRDTAAYAKEGQIIDEKITRHLSHIRDNLLVQVEQVEKSKSVVTAHFSAEHKHTLGGFLHLVHINGSCIVPNVLPRADVSADYAIVFINRPNEFKYAEQSYGKQKGLALGAISFSKVSPFKNPAVVAKAVFNYKPLEEVLSGEMEPVPERKHFLPETHEECLNDVRNGKALSVQCIKAVREWAIYNNMRIHAVWDKELPWYVRSVAEKLDLSMKRTYFTHLETERKTGNKELRLETVYIDKMTDEPVVDIRLDMPTETVWYNKINAGWIQPMSSIDTIFDTYRQQVTNNTYPATCAVMEKYVRTYDLKTYALPKDVPTCTYVVSTHCTENKKFAVLAKIDAGSGTKEIHMYLGNEEIVLTPPTRREYTIRYNGQSHTVRLLQPIMLQDISSTLAFANLAQDGTVTLEVQANKAGVKVIYDGKNVQVEVHPRYKGELCGLCSEFDGEVLREWRGVDRCLYSDSGDFAKNAIVGSCASKEPQHPYMCNTDEVHFSDNQWSSKESEGQHSNEETAEPSLKRNIVLSRNNHLCFATKAIATCDEDSRPSQSRTEKVGFHCLPKQDRNARKLVTEAKRRILGEMETKPVDLWEQVEVAVQC